jgi:hypothetical protein
MNKKQMILAAAMLIAATNISYAQFFFPSLANFSPVKKEFIDRNYTADLSSEYTGIVESALAVVTMVKLDLPADELPLLKAKIKDLVTSGATPVIRYKAYLAGTVFSNPTMFKRVSSRSYSTPDEFFNALAGTLSQTLFSSK